jgi:hypothetical protein
MFSVAECVTVFRGDCRSVAFVAEFFPNSEAQSSAVFAERRCDVAQSLIERNEK